jgi:hypothetical protein
MHSNVGSIARHLDIAAPQSADDVPATLDLEPIDGRDLGGVWVLDQLWSRLGIDSEIRKLARTGPKLDVALLERIVFALVAGRALAPSSKLEATRWIRRAGRGQGRSGRVQLNRTVWVVDAGFTSATNRKVLTGGGSGCIIAEKLRGNEAAAVEARSRQGRFKTVDETLQVKDIRVGEGVDEQRFVMVRNLEAAAHDAHVRDRLVRLLEDRIEGSCAGCGCPCGVAWLDPGEAGPVALPAHHQVWAVAHR